MEQGAGDLGTNKPPAAHPELTSQGKTGNQQLAQWTRLGWGTEAWPQPGLNPGQAGLLEEGTSHLALQDKEELAR